MDYREGGCLGGGGLGWLLRRVLLELVSFGSRLFLRSQPLRFASLARTQKTPLPNTLLLHLSVVGGDGSPF